jgi:outer membrane lipoprotein LolB
MLVTQGLHRWSSLLLSIWLSGCSMLQPKPSEPPLPEPVGTPAEMHQQHIQRITGISAFYLQGRIGIQTEGKGVSGATRWRHSPQLDDISMLSPVGGTVAKIIASADGVTLTTNDGKHFEADSAEDLTQEHLGWRLPLTGLPDWAIGRPAKKLAEYMEWDAYGRITKLHQAGWEIEYPEYMQAKGYHLPKKVTLRNSKMTLKLVIESWEDLADAKQPPTLANESTQ